MPWIEPQYEIGRGFWASGFNTNKARSWTKILHGFSTTVFFFLEVTKGSTIVDTFGSDLEKNWWKRFSVLRLASAFVTQLI